MASLILAPTSPLWAIVPPAGGRTLFSNSNDGWALYVKLWNGTYEKLDATFSVSGVCSPCGWGGGGTTDCDAVATCIDTNAAVQSSLASYLTSNGYSSLVFVASAPVTPWSDSHIEINTTNGDIYTSDGATVITNSGTGGAGGWIQYATDPSSIGGRITFSVGVNADTIDEALIEYDSATNTWNWNTVTQTGATTFDASYAATYVDGSTVDGDIDYVNATIDHINSTVNYDATSTVNNNGNAINNTGNTITNTGVTENYDATSNVTFDNLTVTNTLNAGSIAMRDTVTADLSWVDYAAASWQLVTVNIGWTNSVVLPAAAWNEDSVIAVAKWYDLWDNVRITVSWGWSIEYRGTTTEIQIQNKWTSLDFISDWTVWRIK